MRLFFSYLRRKALSIVFFVICVIIFLCVFSLYSLPVEAVGYAAVLCLCAGAAVFVPDFCRYVGRVHSLSRVTGEPDSVSRAFSESDEGIESIEAEYRRIAKELCDKLERTVTGSESARRDMSDYYAMWVHQIKTPMFALRLLTEKLPDSCPEKRTMLTQQLYIEQYVEMTLCYLRLDSANDLVLHEICLERVVNAAIKKFAPLFIGKKIRLETKNLDSRVISDEKWLGFIVEQLLSNALKYTASGKITVEFDCGVLSVTDTGIGIEPEDLPRIFDKGYTGFTGRKNEKSTGLGLYLCRRTAGLLSVNLELDSAPGKGTRAKIIFDTKKRVFE